MVSFADLAAVPRAFRGRTLRELRADVGALPVDAGHEILALSDGRPVWTLDPAGAGRSRSVLAPAELPDGARLRDALAPGRFLALLPLVEFVRRITAPLAWTAPPAQACFILDDPNLHHTRYGYVRYAELAEDAERNDYHVAMALIPLDAFYASTAACDIFRRRARRLSLLVHGNDHIRGELGRDLSAGAYDSLLAQSLRRVSRFERRRGLRVARVMAPPHGACSDGALGALDRAGFDGVSSTNAYSWIARTREAALAGWEEGGFAAGCLGALPRIHLDGAADDAVFRSYLDQPLILYGHHDDLKTGPDRLAELARQVHGLGPVSWEGLDAIVERRVETRVDGSTLAVRPLARRARVEVQPGIDEVEVQLHPSLASVECAAVVCVGPAGIVTRVPEDGRARFDARGAGSLELRLVSSAALDPELVSPSRLRLWPVARRVMTYTRDQATPLMKPASRQR